MTGSGSLLLGAVFLLTLAMQQTGAANPGVFDLPKKIQEFVDHESRRFNVPVNWWNMYGNHSHLIEFAEKYRDSTQYLGSHQRLGRLLGLRDRGCNRHQTPFT
ncbi:uncharacterized protein LOC120837582 [Ixodes scapularis]|uniref:uncharacterized protein LOC120837582 n=1 Tax=Ixodes scapularis TaxID=6945 RepID=UPI001C383CAF|nr:uncharacterized protein LOC120837582 [Ixodes scapularis]